jgi:predicted ATPase/DNA-binding winged helix-turn-helix (wHTH) protein
MNDSMQPQGCVSFGPFRLNLAERLLERNGVTVTLGARAFDILAMLATRAGAVVGKKELLAQVWPDVLVGDGCLRFHMGSLRKVLGDGKDGMRYFATIPGRGYCFVAPVLRLEGPGLAVIQSEPFEPTAILPPRLTRMIGRDAEVEEVAKSLLNGRFITLVGAGGMGKTTVAIAIGHRLRQAFGGVVRFIDLGSVIDPQLLPSTVATSVGLASHAPNLVPGLISFLHDKNLLIILDNCEHVIDAVAILAEQIFNAAPDIYILATSREALRVEGEQVYQLLPLSTPPERELDTALTLAFPSVQLFVERVFASGVRIELTDGGTRAIAEICRNLDGIPLAIELAAGRVNAYGVEGIAALLGDRFGVLVDGRRTAKSRHQTLGATLDWSYELLTDAERIVLRRLSVFVGTFTIEAAEAVLGFAELGGNATLVGLGNLVSKSLVAADLTGSKHHYRLLDTTRTYARSRLQDSEEAHEVSRRHALYCLNLLEEEHGYSPNVPASNTGTAREHLGNIRAALSWCFGEAGDRKLGTNLAASAVSTFVELSLLSECREWAQRGIAALSRSTRGTSSEISLQAALGHSLMFTEGNSDRVEAAFIRGVELARKLRKPFMEMRLLGSLHLFNERIGNYRGAVEFAERSKIVAEHLGHPAALSAAGSFLGLTQHLMGNHAAAYPLLNAALAEEQNSPQTKNINFGFDYGNRTRITLARHLWLIGKVDQAAALAERAIQDAAHLKNPVTLAIALIWGITVSLWIGDDRRSHEKISMFITHAKKHSLNPYNAVGLGYMGELFIQRGDNETGIAFIQEALATLHAARYELVTTTLMIALAQGLAMTGRTKEALTMIKEVIILVESNGNLVYMPEVLRVKGEILATQDFDNFRCAEACFGAAMEWATRQGAVAWELRIAMSMATLRAKQGRLHAADDTLSSIYNKFTEGFGSADLKAAKNLLEQVTTD